MKFEWICKLSIQAQAMALPYLLLLSSLALAGTEAGSTTDNNSSNPLIYTRLRHEPNYPQILRNFHRLPPYQERSAAKKLVLKHPNNAGELVETEYKYYENRFVDADSISHDDLIVEALDRTYKTRLTQVYLFNYDNPEDKLRASDKKLVSDIRCRRELDYLTSKLSYLRPKKQINPELAVFFDSFAREEPGLLMGNYHWSGVWRECQKRQVFDLNPAEPSDSYAFKGRYCIASIRSPSWDNKIARMTKELQDGGNYFKYENQHYDYARFFRIQVGFCLPESCDSFVTDWAREQVRQLALNRISEPYSNYNLTDLYCLPDETSELRTIETSGRLLILFLVCWCLCVLVATFMDSSAHSTSQTASSSNPKSKAAKPIAACVGGPRKKSNLEKFVSAMSLKRNWHRLTETKSLEPPSTTSPQASISPRPNDLLFLNAFKVISMPVIIWGHTGMLGIHLNRFALDYESMNTFFFHSHINAVFLVDWFFVITGFVTTYVMFVTKRVERNTPLQWLYAIFHRYWRLAPLYVLIFWWARSLFMYTSSGPVWDYGTSNMTIRGICRRESWLSPITLTSNFHPLHEECIMPAWYISNDMQFFLVTPPLLLLLYKSPAKGWLTSLLLLAICSLFRFHRYWTDPRANHIELMRPRSDLYMRNNWDLHATYVYPHYRFGSYLIGLLGGHYAYMVATGKWSSILYSAGSSPNRVPSDRKQQAPKDPHDRLLAKVLRLSVFTIASGLVLSMSAATWLLFVLFPQALEPYAKFLVSFVYTIDHMTVSLGLVLMFLGLMFGTAPVLKRVLSHPAWTLCSRLNFFVFLCQLEYIYWFHQGAERVVDFSDREMIRHFLSLASMTYLTSFVVTLWLELPLAHLEREFIGSRVMASPHPATTSQLPLGPKKAPKNPTKQVSNPLEATSSSETRQLVGGNLPTTTSDRKAQTK